MRIQHNISALNSYNKLAGNNNRLSKNLEKLSSGYKINRAADDAAGLAISEKMRAQITGLETCQQNSKDGISLVQTAEGALTEVHSMLNRMVALTTQASNGIYEDGERQKIQDELDQLNDEIDRIADATNFNGIKLLDGSLSSTGSTTSSSSSPAAQSVSITSDLYTTNQKATAGVYEMGAAIPAGFVTSNLDNGGHVELTVTLGDGSTVSTRVDVKKNASNKFDLYVGDEKVTSDLAAVNNITASEVAKAAKGDLEKQLGDQFTIEENAGKLTFTAKETGSAGPSVKSITFAGDKDGNTPATAAIDGMTGANSVKATDQTMGILDSEFANKEIFDGTNEDKAVFEINGKKFAIAADGTNADKLSDGVILLVAGSSPTGNIAATDLQDDAVLAGLSRELGLDVEYSTTAGNDADTASGLIFKPKDGTTASSSSSTSAGNALRLQIGDTNDPYNMLDVNVDNCHADAIGVGKTTMRVDDVDTANKAMMAAKDAIEYISSVRSRLGAIQNRLDHTLNNLEETTTNLTDAESRIRDTDMAQEMMKYTKNNILIQSSQAMLAQANQVPQGVLQLLQ